MIDCERKMTCLTEQPFDTAHVKSQDEITKMCVTQRWCLIAFLRQYMNTQFKRCYHATFKDMATSHLGKLNSRELFIVDIRRTMLLARQYSWEIR